LYNLRTILNLGLTWVSLGPGYPKTVVYKNIKIKYVGLEPESFNSKNHHLTYRGLRCESPYFSFG